MYIDTSVLLAYYYPETFSEKIEDVLIRTKDPVISWLTKVEFCSAVAKKVRMNLLDELAAITLIDTFQSHINHGHYRLVPLNFEHFIKASTWIKTFQTSLRTLDALHLAVAACENISIFTQDKILATSARTLQLKVKNIH